METLRRCKWFLAGAELVALFMGCGCGGTSNGQPAAEQPVVTAPATHHEELSFQKAKASWHATAVPYMYGFSGLRWDATNQAWIEDFDWAHNPNGPGPSIYYLEPPLRAATRLAIAHNDFSLLDQLTTYHLALLQLTTSIGQLSSLATGGNILYLSGNPADRTFAWFLPQSDGRITIRECELCNAQYLSTSARLMRAIAHIPPADRTPTLDTFATQYGGFLVHEQVLRLLHDDIPWSHPGDPNIPQPCVAGWKFLADTGYVPVTQRWRAAMSDTELWLLMSAGEILATDAADPNLLNLTSHDRDQLHTAVHEGTRLLQARSHHVAGPQGTDVLEVLASDYYDHPDFAYAGVTAPEPDPPSSPVLVPGIAWDISHAYRFPIVFRSLYENRSATGESFPSESDLAALANGYALRAYTGVPARPIFTNYLDGNDGWYRVGYSSMPSGYPPHQYCTVQSTPQTCLTPGAIQGWGELAFASAPLAAVEQALADLANDTSSSGVAFRTRYYGADFASDSPVYGPLLFFLAGDNAEKLGP